MPIADIRHSSFRNNFVCLYHAANCGNRAFWEYFIPLANNEKVCNSNTSFFVPNLLNRSYGTYALLHGQTCRMGFGTKQVTNLWQLRYENQ